MRKFSRVKEASMKFPEIETKLPDRADNHSAGYDFYSKENYVLKPGESHIFWSDVKALMWFDNVLHLYTRSGNGTKRGIVLRNNVGIIDASYANNPTNDGNIGICLYNSGAEDFEVKTGDRIAQGVFVRYLITEDDRYLVSDEKATRTGGFGSSGN